MVVPTVVDRRHDAFVVFIHELPLDLGSNQVRKPALEEHVRWDGVRLSHKRGHTIASVEMNNLTRTSPTPFRGAAACAEQVGRNVQNQLVRYFPQCTWHGCAQLSFKTSTHVHGLPGTFTWTTRPIAPQSSSNA